MVWVIARRGPTLFQRLSQFVAPGQMLVTAFLLGLLFYRFGPAVLWTSDVRPDRALTHDHVLGFAYAAEFGVSNALTWWPIMGGLTRLVKRRRHLLGPAITGVGVLGATFISSVAAIAAARAGTPDPTRWLLALGGPVLGTAMLVFVLAANLITMVILIYLAAVSVQQVRQLTRVPWDLVLALLLAPGVYFAFRTAWVLDVVMAWLSYNGVMFVGITGITLVDYFVLRRQSLDAPQLFTRSASGKYWYWGGVNWAAVGVALASIACYFYLYNPTTYRVAFVFRYFGAGIPTMVLAAASYYCLAYFLMRRVGKGAYPTGSALARSDSCELPAADVSL
jgi:NCS1 family nucleobase:cation symporter-1